MVEQNILPDGDVQGKPGPGLLKLLLQQAQAAFESPDHWFVCLESKQNNIAIKNTKTEIKHYPPPLFFYTGSFLV